MTVLPILQEMFPDIDFATCDTLIEDGIMDSLDITTLIAEVASEFDIEIPVEEIIPENFNSCQALDALLERLDD